MNRRQIPNKFSKQDQPPLLPTTKQHRTAYKSEIQHQPSKKRVSEKKHKCSAFVILLLTYVVTTLYVGLNENRHRTNVLDSRVISQMKGSEKTTVVLMGYYPSRIPNFDIILSSYGQMEDEIDQILLIWNSK